MKFKQLSVLWRGFIRFYHFSPLNFWLILILMLLQGVTSGIGLLLVLPLLQLVGIEVGATVDGEITERINALFRGMGIALNLENVLIFYVVVIGIMAALRYQLTVRSTEMLQQYICWLRNRLYRALLESRWQFIINRAMSDFVHSLSVQVQGIGVATQQIVQFISQLILMMVMVGLAFMLSWQMSLVAVGFSFILILFLLPLNYYIHGSGKSQLANYKIIFQLMSDQLGSLKMVKSYGGEDQYAAQVQQVSGQLERQVVRLSRYSAFSQGFLLVGGAIALTSFLYYSIEVLETSLAILFLLLVIFSRLMPVVTLSQRTWQHLLHQLPSFQDVEVLLRQCQDAKEMGGAGLAKSAPVLQEQLQLRNICYHYPGHDRVILQSFSLTILRNQSVAIIGPSGSGKTTLADLIAGLLEPDSGSLCCDGVPLEGARRIAWRRSIAYVTQEVYLFHDTIRANLNWVAQGITDQQIWDALELAAAKEFVVALPEGLDSVVGDRGIRLSGGERQRLALARALLSKPQLLILDEATSALDYDNERKIQRALQQLHGQLTILIIAHRKATIEHADQVIDLTPLGVNGE